MKKLISLCLLIVVLLTVFMTACKKSENYYIKSDSVTVDDKLFSLYASRLISNLEKSGLKIETKSFWEEISIDGESTNRDYYLNMLKVEISKLLAVSDLFDALEKEGKIKISDSQYAEIEDTISGYIEMDADNDEKKMNEILSKYGTDIDSVRTALTLELKRELLLSYYYGNNGSNIGDILKNQYMNEYYVAFRQILFASFKYDFQKDKNGDDVYFDDNGKIAYDKENGEIKYENDKIILDDDRNYVYFLENGHIAYDKTNGNRKILTDESGNAKKIYYSKSELKTREEDAKLLADSIEKGDTARFEALMYAFSAEANANVENLDYLFVFDKEETYTEDYLNTLKSEIESIEIGEIKVVSTEYGTHILMRYEIPSKAYEDSNYSSYFENLNYKILKDMVNNASGKYLNENIKTNNDLINNFDFLSIESNYFY